MPLVPQPFRVVEIFAGDAKLSKSMHYAEISTAQLDVKMGTRTWNRTRKAFDLLTCEGLACFGCMMVLFASGRKK
jgi:hypothetical protein